MQPGPIVALNPADYDLGVDPPEFEDGITADLAALDPEDQIQSDASDALSALEATDVEAALGTGLDDAQAGFDGLDAMDAADGTAGPDTSDADAQTVDYAIKDVYNEIPGEAFQPEELSFTVPATTPTIPEPVLPTIPTTHGETQPILPSWPPQPWVGLTNISNPGVAFVQGDLWQIDIGATAGLPITMSGSHAGQSFDQVDMGIVGGDGHFILVGRMTFAEAGDWIENWAVNGIACYPGPLIFTVT
jgi:hypothetical protein